MAALPHMQEQDPTRVTIPGGLPPRIELFGVPMDAIGMDQTIAEIDRRISAGEFTQHVVVNVAKLVQMQNDKRLAAAVTSCDLINIDGAGVVFGGRILGRPIPERVAGIDLFQRLLAYAEDAGRPVYLLGAAPAVIERTVAAIRTAHPRLRIAGHHHGYFWEEEARVVQAIRASGAELLFVGIGSPLKEQFIARWREALGVRFAMGVGGSFDVIAGKVRRAPRWMQRMGLEWLFRVLQEPRRMWKRYLVTNSIFLKMVLAEKLRGGGRSVQ
jgi:N-acetylglucosaminyldiphosphoundecaprenol N-acetyl-beta-D-mannosaminyltransferase